MENIIKQHCTSNEIVELYSNPDDYDKFGVGYILACSENEYLVHTFQENDLDDGYYVMRNEDLFLLRKGSTYLRNMVQFIKPKALKYELPRGYWPELDLFIVLLNLCAQEHIMAVVRIECGMALYGWITNVQDNTIEVEEVDGDGMPNGTSYLRLDDLHMVGFGGLEETRRTKLYSTKERNLLQPNSL